ncbi:MAG: hypothetical protein A3F26_03345 [Candidatus Ryanbacteria bacterium RIFCSPHIGHO2_12_FULL_47_12b]|uniref:HTH merR-type domain-containing protein n=2 Tax=Candidatus Ryaniibacteriota TaxID=1817914 RepID=A0A1G2H6T8_9BACT|nr:MAG: hypothetical protein UX74_C0033G0004 [Parcubacteria group bacterium GW2011_GWA2_47_10b]OGZ46281.1 MAG: hypothetical protein A2844_02080 [Candidatus Ryanbacteria bacterium RIFCSPHIGHO2_01_FULL_48_80]OGZ50183.1 MAG: hypothetical protein A3C83_01945 [Candidatus Ryanbacteria bacterium RIFCSPHIGHO2_02_FULL_47_25]OGZ51540.1 MAG: hypothetical protein A3F26_03345 [Candidatus Ryanbacteria bacterium RIFCSPHIGHO2_12_FULL_47_12b]OGZ52812.1 MAG: hypothetical protein A3A29_00885 [Candidatus Ryanbacte
MEQKYLTIKQAATLLGVSSLTLRNWDKKGKLVAHRHPLNNYRVYLRAEIDKLLNKIEADPHERKKLKINFIEES